MKRTGQLLLTVLTLIFLSSFSIHAQDQPTLDQTLKEIIADAESYEEYKVIKTSKMRYFRNQMFDSLSIYQSNISNLQSELSDLKEEMTALKSQFNSVQSDLKASEEKANMIGFLGIDMNKMTYSIFVWSLITLMSLFMIIMYGRIKHVCHVVKRVKSAYSKIVDDYRNQRFQATENQMKLKRELQTALNKLEMVQQLENHSN